MAGFENDVLLCTNVNFNPALPKPHLGTMTSNGQLIIGSTALNAGGTHLNIGTIISPLGTLSIGYSSPNLTMDLTGGSSAIERVALQSGTTPIVPLAGTITFNGAVTAAGTNPVRTDGTGANTMALEVQTSQAIAAADATKIGLSNFNSTDFSVTATGFVSLSAAAAEDLYGWDYIVDSDSTKGTHTTLVAALAVATSGQTILLKTSVTENVTLVAGVTISGIPGAQYGAQRSITGKLTVTGAGNYSISNLDLITNSDNFLSVTGATTGITVNLTNCYLNCLNASGILNSSSGDAQINIYGCQGNIGTTGISLFALSNGGDLNIFNTFIDNTGLSVTASTVASASKVFIRHSKLTISITTSTTGAFDCYDVFFSGGNLNTTVMTTAGTNTNNSITFCELDSGSAPAISIGSGTTVAVVKSDIQSSNTNAIDGAGTLIFSDITYTGTSSNISTTTQTGLYTELAKYTAKKQSAFLAYVANTITNVTGDGTVYTVIFDTEVYDQDANFNLGTSTFTAPVTGKYYLNFSALLVGGTIIGAANAKIVTSNRTYNGTMFLSPGATTSCSANISVLADMDANDTATFTVTTTDTGGKVDDVSGTTGGDLRTWCSGHLAC